MFPVDTVNPAVVTASCTAAFVTFTVYSFVVVPSSAVTVNLNTTFVPSTLASSSFVISPTVALLPAVTVTTTSVVVTSAKSSSDIATSYVPSPFSSVAATSFTFTDSNVTTSLFASAGV